MPVKKMRADYAAAIILPLLYLALYAPYGMDTTDFGYFYGYAWRILEGQIPYRDFSYIKPAFPLYWHAFWMWLTPEKWEILGGKAGFLFTLLGSSWFASLYLNKFFNLEKLNLSTPLLATTGFVFSVHSFPNMPWHTADGALFCGAALWLSAARAPFWGGIFAALALLCKQSFLLVPIAILLMLILCKKPVSEWIKFATGCLTPLFLAWGWLFYNGAWDQFLHMTTGQLDPKEALEAGILIYARQNWILPLIACLPWGASLMLHKKLPDALSPCFCYIIILAIWHIASVLMQKTWTGFGTSWPTLFLCLGAICAFYPRSFLMPFTRSPVAPLGAFAAMAAPLAASWSMAISGGYKIPAFFATPLAFSFFIMETRFGFKVRQLAFLTLFAGLVMFGVGYQYPYVFPVRPLERSWQTFDAGAVYKRAQGVKIDADMLARLEELKMLRQKYGAAYKTLPGFSMSYYLNDDYPVYGSDWLIDWEINGEVHRLYEELCARKLTVFMEKDQADATQADGYARAGYSVPQLVRQKWRIVEETPHFIVFQPPAEGCGEL